MPTLASDWKLPPRQYDMWKEGELDRILSRGKRPSNHKFNLQICEYPGNNESHRATNRWIKKKLLNVWTKDKRIGRLRFWDESSTPITMVRNRSVFEAIRSGMDYILMIDSDMNPDTEPGAPGFWESSWEFMLKRRAEERQFIRETAARLFVDTLEGKEGHDAALRRLDMETYKAFAPATIAAPYCGPPPHEAVYVFRYDNHESNTPHFNFKLRQMERDAAAMYTGIFEVPALATGLIIYDVRTFVVLPPPHFYYEYLDEPYQAWMGSTEDVVQTRNAHFCGMPQFCNWDCWAGHIKPKTVVKPYAVAISSIPDKLSEQMRKRRTENHKVVLIKRSDDDPVKPAEIDVPNSLLERMLKVRSQKTGQELNTK